MERAENIFGQPLRRFGRCRSTEEGTAAEGEYTQLPTLAEGKPAATIYFIRKAHFVGAATRFDVRIDGFTVAAIGSGRHAAVRVPAGMRSIGTRDMNMTV